MLLGIFRKRRQAGEMLQSALQAEFLDDIGRNIGILK
jgi:hypothetical protein